MLSVGASKNPTSDETLCNSWNILESSFRPLVEGKTQFANTSSNFSQEDIECYIPYTREEIITCISHLQNSFLLETFEKFIIQIFICKFDSEVFPAFVTHLKIANIQIGQNGCVLDFLEAANQIQKFVSPVLATMKYVDSLKPSLESLFVRTVEYVRAFFICQIEKLQCRKSFEKLFVQIFNMLNMTAEGFEHNKYKFTPRRSLRSSARSSTISMSSELCQIRQNFHSVIEFFHNCEMFDPIFSEPLKGAVEEIVREAVHALCTTDFAEAETEFAACKDFVDLKCINFVADIVCPLPPIERMGSKVIKHWSEFLADVLLQQVASLRIEQMFAMIVEYPDSQPAIDNLKSVITTPELTDQLIRRARSAFELRLLHPGANTSEILTQYINAIKVLQQLDSNCAILDRVCAPVVKYLRSREDTVRCIVSNMTEDAELAGELLRRCELQLATDPFDSDDENVEWWTWEPAPRDVSNSQSNRKLGGPITSTSHEVSQSHKNQDIMSILVNIYGCKELFVNEYRSLLADRILNSNFKDFDSEKELRHLELLSYKFGHDEINKCNVMLRDVAESKKTSEQLLQRWKQAETPQSYDDVPMEDEEINVKNEKLHQPDFPITATIISGQFWPTLKEEKFELPQQLKAAFMKYKSSYEAVKLTRTVEWIHHFGKVDIEIETNDGNVRQFTVTPTQAAVLHILENETKVNIDDLSSTLGISVSVLRRKLGSLFSLGVLSERNGVLEVIEESSVGQGSGVEGKSASGGLGAAGGLTLFGSDDDESDSAMANEKELKEEQMKCYWMYTMSMLRNLKSMSAETIHSMIKMFSKAGNSTELTQEELTAFLNKKVKEDLLCYSNGVYRLPDKS